MSLKRVHSKTVPASNPGTRWRGPEKPLFKIASFRENRPREFSAGKVPTPTIFFGAFSAQIRLSRCFLCAISPITR